MLKKFNHPAYVSEKELSDKLETFFIECKFDYIREFKFGRSIFDFVLFKKAVPGGFKVNPVTIIEVKLNADFNSVRQLAFYQRLVEQTLLEQGRWDIQVGSAIYAKTFDSTIPDVMAAAGIQANQINLLHDLTIEINSIHFEESNYIVDGPEVNKLLQKMPVQNG